MIDQQTITRIFETADIVDVISDFVNLKKSGANYKGLSPFSSEKTPSFMVSPAKGIFKDFSSGKGGNVVGFLMEHEKLSYPEALRYLANKYNIPIEEKELSAEELQQKNERESLLAVTAFAAKYFSQQLKNEEGAAIGLSYFRSRGFREDTIKKFELGYSPEARSAFSSEASKNGYKAEYLVKSGMSIQSERDQSLFDRFSGRVIFPIHALSGSVIGFGGRTLKNDKKTAKYLNSPESDIYHKSKVLYGLFQAKKSIVSKERCFLVEGYTDVISMHQAGIENVVASSGTALTTEQIRLIKRFTSNITILYDGDDAGIRASFRGIDMILEEGLNVKVVLFPQGEDPDSFARTHNSSEFLDFIEKGEKDFISFKTELLLAEARQDPVKKAQLISDIVRSVSVIPDGIMRSVYLKDCGLLLGVEEQVLYNEVNKLRAKRKEEQWKKDRSRDATVQAAPTLPRQPLVPAFVENVFSEVEEREIIYFLLKFGKSQLRLGSEDNVAISVAEYIIREIQNDELEFNNLIYKQVFSEAKQLLEAGEKLNERPFIYHENQGVRELAVDIFTSRYELSKVWKRKEAYVELPGENLALEVPKSLLSYKMSVIEKALSGFRLQLKEAQEGKDVEALTSVLKQIQRLEKIKIALSEGLGKRAIIR